MKILITGNNSKEIAKLSNLISEYYEINNYNIDELVNNKINSINKENKSYILNGIYNKELEFIINIVDQIIFLDFKTKNNIYEFDIKELFKRINKYSKELIIIKNKKELKKYLNAVYKNDNYIE